MTTEAVRMRRYADFFDAELTPLIRRMADRPRHDDAPDLDRREIRAMVWQGLVSLRAPDPTHSASYGDRNARQRDLVTLAEMLGAVLYQGPLLDTISAAELFLRNGSEQFLADIADGASVAFAIRADGAASPAEAPPLMVGRDGDTIDAQRCFVGFAAEADYIVVVGGDAGGTRLALVRRDHPSVTSRRYEETGRGELFEVRFAGTPVVAWLGDGDDWSRVLANARIRQAGYLVGLSQGALDLAVAYAKKRRQFGQPIARFQSLAFRLSELSLHIDAARLLTHSAAEDRDRGIDVRLVAAQCLASTADLARMVTTAVMQVHGAAGMVSTSDAQLFYRRAAVEAFWLGTPTQLRAEAVPLLALRLMA